MVLMGEAVKERYLLAGLSAGEAEVFLRAYGRYEASERSLVRWGEISSPDPSDLVPHQKLKNEGFAERAEMGAVAWVVLNGGLGTTMKMTRAKSLLPVKDGLTFLDLLARHVLKLRKRHGAAIPLVFMNSFATNADTFEALGRYEMAVTVGGCEIPSCFMQNQFPRIREDGKGFFSEATDPAGWAPPGHGDLYQSLKISGVMDKLLCAGKTHLFVSNADNLGASPDPSILGFLQEKNIPFALEVTARTPADVKGGTVVRHGGRLELLELAQVDEEHAADFQDIGRFSVFNTNSLWIDLRALKERLEKGHLDLPLIINRKTVAKTPVIQLETAMGSAIGSFEGAAAIVVGRERFAPVKTTNDFLLRRSDLYA
ncbi:UTP--glucose-1-phosphate uridylyltransferase, partial [bacterium]